MAVENFKSRGYAKLGGIIFQKKGLAGEDEAVELLRKDFDTEIVGIINRSEEIAACDEKSVTVVTEYPECQATKELSLLADTLIK